MVILLFSNKYTIKRPFKMLLFLFTYQNNITEVFLTNITFLYTINRLNDEAMSLPNGI